MSSYIRVLNTIAVRGSVAFGNFLLPILIAHYYGLSDLGLFVTIISAITFFHILLKFGMDKTLMREVAKLSNISDYIVFSIKIFLLVYFFLGLVVYIYNNIYEFEYTFFILLTSIPFTLLMLNSTILQALRKPDLGLSFNPGLASLILCIVVYFFHNNFTIDNILIMFSGILWVMLIISVIATYSFVSHNNNKEVQVEKWRESYIRSSFIFLLISIFIFSQQISLTFTLNYFESMEVVGLVRYAEKLSLIFTFPLLVIVALFSPKFSYNYSKNNIEALNIIFRKSLRVCFISGIACIFIFIAAYYYFVDSSKAGYERLGYYVLPFFLAQLVNLLTGPSDILLSMAGKEKFLLFLTVSSGILSMILFYFALMFSALLLAVYLLNLVYLFRNVIQYFYAIRLLKPS
ncbi:lipopolysaccharide biosynthesis protein [Acinetobacter haemolyticus]|uniref:lipopolysaccharide biosynthesis protein n=1 Tax=Acinetobacter haemolyticus TaxID=29430 RepID=UPI003AF4E72D